MFNKKTTQRQVVEIKTAVHKGKGDERNHKRTKKKI